LRGHVVLLTPAEAERLIGQNLALRPIESLPLAQCAGAVLRENIYAERDQPPFDRVAMDGIAIDSRALAAGVRTFRIQGMQPAGDAPHTLAATDACIEIMTGAVRPIGADAVVPVEQLTVHDGMATLVADFAVTAGQNIHIRASDAPQGALLLTAGARLSAPEIAIAASAGVARIKVACQPSVAVLSTGNELIEPGEPILAHQVRRSNAYGIAAALKLRGLQRVADDHARDDLTQLTQRLKFHLDTHDLLVLSGGVSAGRLDLVPRALSDLGVRAIFHKVAQRPGMPLWFGVAPNGATVFALPGNPVSTLICLSRYVLPAIFNAMGEIARLPRKIALSAAVTVKAPLAFFMPVRIEVDAAGHDWASPCPTNGSGDFTALAATDGFVELPPGPQTYPKGFVSDLYRW
jgi:molybdopterin molybdotransferase